MQWQLHSSNAMFQTFLESSIAGASKQLNATGLPCSWGIEPNHPMSLTSAGTDDHATQRPCGLKVKHLLDQYDVLPVGKKYQNFEVFWHNGDFEDESTKSATNFKFSNESSVQVFWAGDKYPSFQNRGFREVWRFPGLEEPSSKKMARNLKIEGWRKI